MKNSFDYSSDANSVTRISTSTRFDGKLVAEGDVRVDGTVDGILCSSGRVVAGETAKLSGSLYCDNLDLMGKMDGDIYVKDELSLKSTAVVTGHISVNKLQVEIGAQITGSCKMITEQEFQALYTKAVAAPKPEAPAVKPAVAAAAKPAVASAAPAARPAPKPVPPVAKPAATADKPAVPKS